MPQFERLWGDYWLSEPDRDSSISLRHDRVALSGDVKLLERAGLLKSVSFKMPWPVPDPTDPRHPWSVQLTHIVERNERWYYGRRTKLRLLLLTQALAERIGVPSHLGAGWEQLIDRDDYEFFARASGSPTGTSASRR